MGRDRWFGRARGRRHVSSSIALTAFAALVVVGAGCADHLTRPSTNAPIAPKATSVAAGTSGDYPPLSLWTTGPPQGFAPSLLDGFARSERLAVTWTRFRWPELATDLRAGRFEVVADGITVRPERSIAGRFTVPIAIGGAVLLVRSKDESRSARPSMISPGPSDPFEALRAFDRSDRRVAVNLGGHLERVARSLLSNAEVVALPNNTSVRDAFVGGAVDAVMTNTFEAPEWRGERADVRAIGPLTRDVTALWVRADRSELAERLDAWLLDEEASGRLAPLRIRYLGVDNGGATALPVTALLAATVERLALMPFVAAAKARRRQDVADPEQEARVLASARAAVGRAAAERGTTPPRAEAIDAFFRAEIEAAKDVQRRAPAAVATDYRLDRDLRPAIARITSRMALLAARVPRDVAPDAVQREAREALAGVKLDPPRVDALASAIAALGGFGVDAR